MTCSIALIIANLICMHTRSIRLLVVTCFFAGIIHSSSVHCIEDVDVSLRMAAGDIYGAVQQQALMISMKELYGWLILIALFCLLVFQIYESDIRPYKVLHPTYRPIRRLAKHELRMDKKLDA